MKYIYILLFIFIINCTGNKVSNFHGVKSLQSKYEMIVVDKTNKNDLINIIGPPSTKSDFNKNKWFYLERLKTNQSLLKLGTQKIKKNNILVVNLNEYGIVSDKKILDLNNMNDVKFLKDITQKDFKENDYIYKLFSSIREKINSPVKKYSK
tara:strand:- start:462 stop:917 length:456 start_codon:yes stop_codon:yes gene_type:complete